MIDLDEKGCKSKKEKYEKEFNNIENEEKECNNMENENNDKNKNKCNNMKNEDNHEEIKLSNEACKNEAN